MQQRIRVHVNGVDREVDVEPRRLLLDMLRDDLGLTGTKEGCSVGVCGACSVLVDGRLTAACLELAVRCDGAVVTTIEGLAVEGANGAVLDPVQQAFVDHGGFQCGICTPGMVITAKALLDANPDPSDDEIRYWMMGSLCRCTGYYGIVTSIKAAVRATADARRVQALR